MRAPPDRIGGPVNIPVSAFLITRNEEQRLARTLAALDWVDDIVVVDSGSTDRTGEIARAAGARFVHRDWTGYGPQKRHAEELCRHDWLLNVDADEVVTPDLAQEIQTLIARGPAPGTWKVRILNVYPGDRKPRPLANDYDVVRLYHRTVARYRDHPLFDRVVSNTIPGQLRAPIHHFPLHSFHQMVEKENDYSTYTASVATPRSRPLLVLRLFFQMPWSFLKFYFFKGHVLGGYKGFMFALTAAFARTLRIAKMLERGDKQDLSQDGY